MLQRFARPTTIAVSLIVLAVLVVYAVRLRAGRTAPAGMLGAPPGAAAGWNVLLITLDTTRADRLGCYGYAHAETPHLDALAAGGVRFDDAVTCVPMTLPSHASIHTGLYPPNCDVRDNGLFTLDAAHETLAERLRAEGYATAAFIAAFVLDRRYGLDQGFDVYNDDITLKYRQAGVRQAMPQRPADAVVDDALRWLDGYVREPARRPFFLWVHLFDPHTPYLPPEPFRSRFAGFLYDGEIAFMDQQVGRLLDGLRSHGLAERTLSVAVGDHGEGLEDHDESTHSLLIYDSTMRVPLIWHAPGVIPAGRAVADAVVATVDVLPTVLDLLGMTPVPCDGVSLLRTRPSPQRAVYLETVAPLLNHNWSALYGLRTHTDKYIEAPTPEYYDLHGDPQELSNLAEHDERAAQLRQRLDELMSGFPDGAAVRVTHTPDAEAIRKLQALGYVGGAPPDTTSGPRPDPKDMIAGWEHEVFSVVELVDAGQFAEAAPRVQRLLETMPLDGRLWNLLSLAQAGLEQLDDAYQSRLRCLELQPEDADHWIQLAHLQRKRGDFEGMASSLEEAASRDPDHGEIYLLRAERAAEAGDWAQAMELCAEARRRDPTRHTATSWSLQGFMYRRMGRREEARAAFKQAYAADPRNAGALYGLALAANRAGDPQRVIELVSQIPRGETQWALSRSLLAQAYLRLDRDAEALQVMQSLVEMLPTQAWAHGNLGNVCYQLGRRDEAVASYRQAIALDPKYAIGHYNLGSALEEHGAFDEAAEHLRAALDVDPTLHPAEFALAQIEARTGRIDECLARLKRLLAVKAISMAEIERDPKLEAVRSDPRFQQLRDSLPSPQ